MQASSKETYLADYYKRPELASSEASAVVDGDFFTAWMPEEKSSSDEYLTIDLGFPTDDVSNVRIWSDSLHLDTW